MGVRETPGTAISTWDDCKTWALRVLQQKKRNLSGDYKLKANSPIHAVHGSLGCNFEYSLIDVHNIGHDDHDCL